MPDNQISGTDELMNLLKPKVLQETGTQRQLKIVQDEMKLKDKILKNDLRQEFKHLKVRPNVLDLKYNTHHTEMYLCQENRIPVKKTID